MVLHVGHHDYLEHQSDHFRGGYLGPHAERLGRLLWADKWCRARLLHKLPTHEQGRQPVGSRTDSSAPTLSQFRHAEHQLLRLPGHAVNEAAHLGWDQDEPGPPILLG